MDESRGRRSAVLVLGVIAAVAIGVALGVLVRSQFGGDDDPPTAGSVDVGFAQDMSTHHNQAIDMAAVALTESTDQPIKNLAFDILTTQQNQVGQMQGWLALWNQPPAATDGYMTWMPDHGSDQHMHDDSTDTAADPPMPGMATSADMTALRQARGPALDTLFLQLMLRHHQGGIPMAEYADQNAEQDVVRNLASTMVQTQRSESDLMTEMLAARGAQPLPMN